MLTKCTAIIIIPLIQENLQYNIAPKLVTVRMYYASSPYISTLSFGNHRQLSQLVSPSHQICSWPGDSMNIHDMLTSVRSPLPLHPPPTMHHHQLTCMFAPGPGEPMNIHDILTSVRPDGMKGGTDMCFFNASAIAGSEVLLTKY